MGRETSWTERVPVQNLRTNRERTPRAEKSECDSQIAVDRMVVRSNAVDREDEQRDGEEEPKHVSNKLRGLSQSNLEEVP